MNIQHIARQLSIKSISDDGLFAGYASVFGAVDSQNEVVAPGAFRRSLAGWQAKGHSPAMLWMHDPTSPIGLWLSMAEDKNGLAVQGKLAMGTQKGKEAYELLKMGALTGLSIGYRVISSQIDKKNKARVLTDVELFEVSLVTFPSNDAARVSQVKSPVARAKGSRRIVSDKQETARIVARLHEAAQALKTNTKRKD